MTPTQLLGIVLIAPLLGLVSMRIFSPLNNKFIPSYLGPADRIAMKAFIWMVLSVAFIGLALLLGGK